MIPLPDPREALATLLVIAASLVTLWSAVEYGRADTAALALDAFAREEHRTELMVVLLDRSTTALSVVLREDAELHDSIRTVVPDWQSIVALSRVSLP
jgi:hypothetical protein